MTVLSVPESPAPQSDARAQDMISSYIGRDFPEEYEFRAAPPLAA
jgi:hypothetical protein